MREYHVLVTEHKRTFQTFKDKEKAILCAKDCLRLGFDEVCVTYKNWNPVPKTPAYTQTEERKLDGVYWIHLMEEAKPHREVQKFKADTIKVIADKNEIDDEFYREFWINGIMTGRYSNKEYYFDFGKKFFEE